MRVPVVVLALAMLPAFPAAAPGLSLEDEAAFRLLREDFHRAQTTGDTDLIRSLLADDTVLTTGDGTLLIRADEITEFLAGSPRFKNSVVHSTGRARRVGERRGVFAEFNGGAGPLPPRAE